MVFTTCFNRPEAIYLPTTTLTPNSPFPLIIYRNYFSSPSSAYSEASSKPPQSAALSIAPEVIEEHFRAHSWIPEWKYPMFYQAHYHSTTHETVGIYQGSAILRFGISDQEYEPSEPGHEREEEDTATTAVECEAERASPISQPHITTSSSLQLRRRGFKGYSTTVYPGDVILIPAGVSHRLVQDLTDTCGEGIYDSNENRYSIPGLQVESGTKLHKIPTFKMVGAYPKGAKRWDMCYGGEHTRQSLGQIWTQVPSTDPVLLRGAEYPEGAEVGVELWRKIERDGGVQRWLEGQEEEEGILFGLG